MRFLLVYLVVLLSLSTTVHAQNCFNYYNDHCSPDSTKFRYEKNPQSVSFLFASAESRSIPFNLQNGKDYRFMLCADPVFNDIIKIRLIAADGHVIYDNSNNNFALNVEFTNRKDQEVEIVIEAPQPSEGISDTVFYEGCIGLLIEEMLTIKTGF